MDTSTSSSSSPSDKNSDVLYELYYQSGNFLSPAKFAELVRKQHPEITIKFVADWLKKQNAYQVSQKAVKVKPEEFSSVLGYRPNENWEMDLGVFEKYAINGYKYYLVIIDVFSRKILCLQALTSRNMDRIFELFQDTVKKFGKPVNVNADNEFNNNTFKSIATNPNGPYEDGKIRFIYSQPKDLNKNPVVERDIGYISHALTTAMKASGNRNWYELLPNIQKNFNAAVHGTTGVEPDALYEHKAVSKQTPNYLQHDLKVGDSVRILQPKNIFDKGSDQTYSDEVHTIRHLDGEKSWVNAKQRYFKPYELKKVNEVQGVNHAIKPNLVHPTDRLLRTERYKRNEIHAFKSNEIEPRAPSSRTTRNPNANYKEVEVDDPYHYREALAHANHKQIKFRVKGINGVRTIPVTSLSILERLGY